MAVTGALIVMTGLTVLAFVISQLHKIAAFLEKKREKRPQIEQAVPTAEPQKVVVPKLARFDLEEAEACLKPLAADLGETFKLADLYNSANRSELPHVHLSIRGLREAGVILPAGEGQFTWQG
jgi:hypothetical protein